MAEADIRITTPWWDKYRSWRKVWLEIRHFPGTTEGLTGGMWFKRPQRTRLGNWRSPRTEQVIIFPPPYNPSPCPNRSSLDEKVDLSPHCPCQPLMDTLLQRCLARGLSLRY